MRSMALIVGSVGITAINAGLREIPIACVAEKLHGNALPLRLIVSMRETWQLFEEGETLFIDARTPEQYRAGHIPAALSVPPDKSAEALAKLMPNLPEGIAVIVYCNGANCESSRQVLKSLRRCVNCQVRVFAGGWDLWNRKGLPVEKGS